MAKRKDPLMVVFGAWEKPNKVVLCGKRKRGDGISVLICELDDYGKYDFGEQVPMEDIGGVYAELLFCKMEHFKGFVNALQDSLKRMEGKENG